MRVLISEDPYVALYKERESNWGSYGIWPCRWISLPDLTAPCVSAYRMRFHLNTNAVIRAHVSADERYELFLDGERIGRGPERGDAANWFYETYDLALLPGPHVIVARVWSLGKLAPCAQMSVRPGFIFSPEAEFIALLGTGVAEWEGKVLEGYSFPTPDRRWSLAGATTSIDAARFSWGFEKGEGDDWLPVQFGAPGVDALRCNNYPASRLMKPASLAPLLDEHRSIGVVRYVASENYASASAAVSSAESLPAECNLWHELIHHPRAVSIPAHSKRRVIVDLEDYYCAYPQVVVSGGRGSSLEVAWAEALYEQPELLTKGNRGDIEGKYFYGRADSFLADGGQSRLFEPLWWQAGRYVQLLIETQDAPLLVESFTLRETRYPLRDESSFITDDERIAGVRPIALRSLQMSAHETYIDCPYYEQLMYAGDTRLEALATYVVTRDDRLARKALSMFDQSRWPARITQSRYPSRATQFIAPFSLWWVGMVYDYALWRGDRSFVASLMPGVRTVLDCMRSYIGEDGLIRAVPGWNFVDWVPEWKTGIPPDGEQGANGTINWQMVLALDMAARLESWLGEPELASRNRRVAATLAGHVSEGFWDAQRHLFAEDLAKKHFSEHSQCLAILSGYLDSERQSQVADALLTENGLSRTTIYFTHYLFQTFCVLNRINRLFNRLDLWFDLSARGFKTTFETPEPSRSDCHGWGSHILYHCFASILGIRPAAMGFTAVTIRPQLGHLRSVRGELPHPQGDLVVELENGPAGLQGWVGLPDGISGTFVWGDKTQRLRPGQQEVSFLA